jgi:hypothetical protein
MFLLSGSLLSTYFPVFCGTAFLPRCRHSDFVTEKGNMAETSQKTSQNQQESACLLLSHCLAFETLVRTTKQDLFGNVRQFRIICNNGQM